MINVITALPFTILGASICRFATMLKCCMNGVFAVDTCEVLFTLLAHVSTPACHGRDSSRSEARRFGASLVLAGAAAMCYHSLPKGRLRSSLRKLDHWTISLATFAMVPAIAPSMPPVTAMMPHAPAHRLMIVQSRPLTFSALTNGVWNVWYSCTACAATAA